MKELLRSRQSLARRLNIELQWLKTVDVEVVHRNIVLSKDHLRSETDVDVVKHFLEWLYKNMNSLLNDEVIGLSSDKTTIYVPSEALRRYKDEVGVDMSLKQLAIKLNVGYGTVKIKGKALKAAKIPIELIKQVTNQ